jgi:hypothetical protein
MALYVHNTSNSNIGEMFIQGGLGIKHSDEIPANLSDYRLLIIGKDEACNPTAASSIRFCTEWGGAVIMGECPKYLAGSMDNLSSISEWFGAGTYGTDGICECCHRSSPGDGVVNLAAMWIFQALMMRLLSLTLIQKRPLFPIGQLTGESTRLSIVLVKVESSSCRRSWLFRRS